jgi:hypothetical protein
MTIGDVSEFYIRRDAAEAEGGEPACTGCDKTLAAGESYANYDIAGKPRTPRNFPASIALCQKCAYMVIAWRPPAPPV